jgi:hypothetical protein
VKNLCTRNGRLSRRLRSWPPSLHPNKKKNPYSWRLLLLSLSIFKGRMSIGSVVAAEDLTGLEYHRCTQAEGCLRCNVHNVNGAARTSPILSVRLLEKPKGTLVAFRMQVLSILKFQLTACRIAVTVKWIARPGCSVVRGETLSS